MTKYDFCVRRTGLCVYIGVGIRFIRTRLSLFYRVRKQYYSLCNIEPKICRMKMKTTYRKQIVGI